jgi:PAB-dependent poly(A)-specific ribonuclease subunit 3
MAGVQEFVPRQLEAAMTADHSVTPGPSFDTSFISQSNPYADQGLNGSSFYQNNTGFQQPVQYHQYAPVGPYSSNMQSYQRTVHDLFIANDFREEIQKRSAATLQTLPNSQLPAHIESYHSLVPLDTTHQKSSGIFGGYSSWIYKAQSSSNGQYYALRRIEGFRLTNEQAIRSAHGWKGLVCAGVVKTVDCFTNRGFGDSSLFFVTDYHPLSKTLAEHHHIGQSRPARGRNTHEPVAEPVLWTYIVQIASALKAIHGSGLAARILDPSKILLTGKNRVRLNGCGVLDVVQFEAQLPLAQLQRQDLANFGLVILSIGANVADVAQNNFARAMDQFRRYYKLELQTAVQWLYSATQNLERNIDMFTSHISAQMTTVFDAALHVDDSLHSDLSREVENGRLFRLMSKLNFVTDTPGLESDSQWAENGDRYFLTLFRDFVFHQVDAQNHPVLDLGHVLTSLNKLDAGSDERITLISRDEQSCYIVSYKELKKGIESAFQELNKQYPRRLH